MGNWDSFGLLKHLEFSRGAFVHGALAWLSKLAWETPSSLHHFLLSFDLCQDSCQWCFVVTVLPKWLGVKIPLNSNFLGVLFLALGLCAHLMLRFYSNSRVKTSILNKHLFKCFFRFETTFNCMNSTGIKNLLSQYDLFLTFLIWRLTQKSRRRVGLFDFSIPSEMFSIYISALPGNTNNTRLLNWIFKLLHGLNA